MTVHDVSGPAAHQGDDLERLRDRSKAKYSMAVTVDNRFTSFLAWCGVILASLMTVAICWMGSSMVKVQQDIAVLLSRPQGVSKEEYNRDATRWDSDINQLKQEVRRPPR